jgi:hypothetical protein
MVNAYLDLFCIIRKFDENGFLIINFTRKESLYYQSKFRFIRNFYFFDIPNEESNLNLIYNYEINTNPEYLINNDLQGFFNFNKEKTINKIKFIRQNKPLNLSSLESKKNI